VIVSAACAAPGCAQIIDAANTTLAAAPRFIIEAPFDSLSVNVNILSESRQRIFLCDLSPANHQLRACARELCIAKRGPS
jgi:hypothetical protein